VFIARRGACDPRALSCCFSFVLRFTLSISGEIIVLLRTLSARAAGSSFEDAGGIQDGALAFYLYISLAYLEGQRKDFLLCFAQQILT